MLGRRPVLAHGRLVVPAAWRNGAYWFRFNLDQMPDIFLDQSMVMVPIVLVYQLGFVVILGVHRAGCWFTSTHDLSVILKSVLVGTVVVPATIDNLCCHGPGGSSAISFSASWPVFGWSFNRHENCLADIPG